MAARNPTFGPSLNTASHTRQVVSEGKLVVNRHRYLRGTHMAPIALRTQYSC
jgi:hypothetical protein